MESQSSRNKELACHICKQMSDSCNLIIEWNSDIVSAQDYLLSSIGMQRMAASCMLIETLGEGAKKIDSLLPDFLTEQAPEIPWKNLKGLRDHIAHGYFNLDADIIFDVAVNEVPTLKKSLDKLISYLS